MNQSCHCFKLLSGSNFQCNIQHYARGSIWESKNFSTNKSWYSLQLNMYLKYTAFTCIHSLYKIPSIGVGARSFSALPSKSLEFHKVVARLYFLENTWQHHSSTTHFFLKGVLHLLPQISMFCVLSQNDQHLFEKQ